MLEDPSIDESIKIAAACRALSDPFRLHAFVLLVHRSSSGDGLGSIDMADATDEVAYALNISPAVVEHHVMELARADLVRIADTTGGRPVLAVNTEMLERTRRYISGAG